MARRLAFTGPFEVVILDYEDGELAADEVMIKTEWASGKHGTTTAMFDGGAFRGQEFDVEKRIFVESDKPPRLPSADNPWHAGTTGVGTITAVGSGVTEWAVGDRVFGLMDVRETNIVKRNKIYHLGDVDPELALCLEPAYVSFHCIRESHVRYGDAVVVIGLGALGLLAVRMAEMAGVSKLFAVDMLPKRREWAAANGADVVFDPRDEDAALMIRDLTGGKGVDVAIELSGSYPGLASAIRSVRIGGTICSAGFYQQEAHGLWLGREWHHNRLQMIVPHGCGWGHIPRDYPLWDEQRAYDTLADMMHTGKLTAPGLIQPVVSLDDGPAVFDLIKNNPNEVIKYAIKF